MYNSFTTPCRSNYDTEEEYEDALDTFLEAESRYEDMCKERYCESRRCGNN